MISRRPKDTALSGLYSEYRVFAGSKWRIVPILILFMVFLFMFKNIFILLILGTVVMLWDYITHAIRLPLHFDGLLFAGVIVTHVFGFFTGFMFCLIAGNLAEILTGNFEITDVISFIPIVALCRLYIMFSTGNLIIVWIVLCIVFSLATGLIAFLLQEPPHKVIIEPVVALVVNLFLFLNFGKPLLWLLR